MSADRAPSTTPIPAGELTSRLAELTAPARECFQILMSGAGTHSPEHRGASRTDIDRAGKLWEGVLRNHDLLPGAVAKELAGAGLIEPDFRFNVTVPPEVARALAAAGSHAKAGHSSTKFSDFAHSNRFFGINE